MFEIDTSGQGGGSQGPWISWTSEGSARKRLEPESWVLRHKPEGANEWLHVNVPAFKAGCVMDLDSIKIGWEKDGGVGQAPERRWNVSPAPRHATPRPSEEKKAAGGFVWGQALSVRCAIGGGQAATWEQASFGAYDSFITVCKQIMTQWAEHSQNGLLLPVVTQTGVQRVQMKSGSSSVPVLSVTKWVPRPDCLKADAPAIAGAAPTPAPAPQPAYMPPPTPQPAAGAAADF